MKKNNNSSKKSFDTAMQKKAENNLTIFNCSIIIYALVLFVVHSMSQSSATAAGAATFRHILMYAGIAGTMLIAAYAAYKSNKSLIKYSLMCAFVSISTAGILFCSDWGIKITIAALVIAFVFTCIYAALTDKKAYYTSKKVRTIFKSAVAVVYGILFILLVIAFLNNRVF